MFRPSALADSYASIAIAVLATGMLTATVGWTQENGASQGEAISLVDPKPLPADQPAEQDSADKSDALQKGEPEASENHSILPIQSQAYPEDLWWTPLTQEMLLQRERWLQFTLPVVIQDTLQHSPLIESVSRRASISLERVVQQDAAFDPNVLLSIESGRTNEPVGNSLTTGGDDRLQDETLDVRAGIQRNTRRGGRIDVSQQLGILDSNSTFVVPEDQGISNLSISLSQPLLDRGGRRYNERLLTQARIDSGIAWHDMRFDVEQRIANVMSTYWRLFGARCHVIQQRDLLQRGEAIERMVLARQEYDFARVELAKIRQRIARRKDRLIAQEAEIRRLQTRLATFVGSDTFMGVSDQLELIPESQPGLPKVDWRLADALVEGAQYRPEVRVAAKELEAASLQVHVTRTELVPQLNAIFNTTFGAINSDFNSPRSFYDQFRRAPGISGAIQYEMPRGRRAAKSRYREAAFLYQQKSAELREAMTQARFEIESSFVELQRSASQHDSKRELLESALDEETVLTRRWELMAGEGAPVGTVLENLLDAQQRRTDAEQERVSTQVEYMVALIAFQRSMGKLLVNEGITPIRSNCDNMIDFHKANLNDQVPVLGPNEAGNDADEVSVHTELRLPNPEVETAGPEAASVSETSEAHESVKSSDGNADGKAAGEEPVVEAKSQGLTLPETGSLDSAINQIQNVESESGSDDESNLP